MARAPSIPAHLRLTLTVPEAAAYLGLPERHVYGLVRSGDLPCIRTGDRGTWHIARHALEAWVARFAAPAAEAR